MIPCECGHTYGAHRRGRCSECTCSYYQDRLADAPAPITFPRPGEGLGPIRAPDNLLYALQELFSAFGVSSAFCGLSGEVTKRDAVQVIRFAAQLKRDSRRQAPDDETVWQTAMNAVAAYWESGRKQEAADMVRAIFPADTDI